MPRRTASIEIDFRCRNGTFPMGGGLPARGHGKNVAVETSSPGTSVGQLIFGWASPMKR